MSEDKPVKPKKAAKKAKSSKPPQRKTSKKDSSIQERLLDGEKIMQQAEIHVGIYWQSIAVLIFALLVGTFVVKELGVLLLVVSGLMALYAFIKKSILLLVLTNKRILVRYGILQIDVVDIHFDKIESVELERMIPGYIMGYANIVIMGTGNRYVVIPYVGNGIQIRRAYNELVLGGKEETAPKKED